MGKHVNVAALCLAGMLAGGVQAGFDPMRPPNLLSPTATVSAAAPQLTWIRFDGRRAIAWYGGRVVEVGDQVEGGRIQAIQRDHLVVNGRAGKQLIPLLGNGVVKQASVTPVLPSRTR